VADGLATDDATMMCPIIIVVLYILKTVGRISYVGCRPNRLIRFWFLVCVATVSNFKPARPPLGGHREVHNTIEEIVPRYTV